MKHGEETFIKVDKTYPLWAADIALRNSNNAIIKKFLIIFYLVRMEAIRTAGFYILEPKDKLKNS